MLIPSIIKLNNQEIIRTASHLSTFGKLIISNNKLGNVPKVIGCSFKKQASKFICLVYLDIDDAYIHNLFPLLEEEQIKKPDYFNKDLADAHVSMSLYIMSVKTN